MYFDFELKGHSPVLVLSLCPIKTFRAESSPNNITNFQLSTLYQEFKQWRADKDLKMKIITFDDDIEEFVNFENSCSFLPYVMSKYSRHGQKYSRDSKIQQLFL